MLKLENVSKYYYSGNHVVLALRRINLELKLGEFVAITGESGSGKSTLLNVLSGLDTYEEGKVIIDGNDLSYYSVSELERYRKDYIGFIFQDYNIIDSYTVYQNVEMALSVQGFTKEQKKQKTLEIIEKVGLTNKLHQKAVKLSGGEKQRTVIARTLAKDCQILVCDEPTGNLDTESSKQILQLLKEIGKDKLVIVVTHDFSTIESYATRKIRLYDGEILEDNKFSESVLTKEIHLEPKTYKTSTYDTIKIALMNVLSVPKKSFFMMIILMFLILVTFFSYGNGIAEQNRPYSYKTPYFSNPDQSRIIITKYNDEQFSEEEINDISQIEYVRSVVNNDTVFDTVLLNRGIDPIYGLEEFYYFRILPTVALNAFDLSEGVLPTRDNEIVITDRTQYQIGDYIGLNDTYLSQETPGMVTDQFVYKVVGIIKHDVRIKDDLHTIYLNQTQLETVALASIYSKSETYLEITGTTWYFTPNEEWITPEMNPNAYVDQKNFSLINPIRIDNGLQDNEIKTFDYMFYDMCRDFGYKKEIPDDMDAGLCPSQPFITNHQFRLSAITTFENELNYVDISFRSYSFEANEYDQNLYMNQKTFEYFFGESNYQITAVVYDVYEGKQVIEELTSKGYNVFYPSQIVEEEYATNILLANIRILLVIFFTTSGVFLVGYLVLRNIIMSKRKDYLIFRSIGTSKKTIRTIIQFEVMYLMIISSVLVLSLIYTVEQFKTPIPLILRYIQPLDYFIIFISIILVLQLMIMNFGKKIFDVNIISSLKGIE